MEGMGERDGVGTFQHYFIIGKKLKFGCARPRVVGSWFISKSIRHTCGVLNTFGDKPTTNTRRYSEDSTVN